MEFQRLKNGTWRVFMTPPELEQILKSAQHRGCRIAILLMCLSLRREPTTVVVPNNFFNENGLWWLEVEGKDSSEEYHETRSRNVWVPDVIMNEILSYIEDENIGDDEPLIWVQERQLSNWIDTAVENAATRTGIKEYKRVSCHDFRRFFATHFLLRLNADAQVVQQLGGWKRIEHMYEYLLMPKDLIKNRLADIGALNTNPLFISAEKNADTIESNIQTVQKIVQDTDSLDTIETAKSEILALVEEIPSLDVTVKKSSQFENNTDRNRSDESIQMSFQQLQDDEQGGVRTSQLARAWSIALVIVLSCALFGIV